MGESLGFYVKMSVPYEAAIEKATEALKAEGFGVLTRIDVQATLKEKLGKDFRPYVILGACNPSLAHRVLSTNPIVGLLLPCNVTVEERTDGVWVSIVNPDVMMSVGGLAEDAGVCGVAAEARARLERVAEALKA
jgi:uncharacterized protein (DUF302 family)